MPQSGANMTRSSFTYDKARRTRVTTKYDIYPVGMGNGIHVCH